MHEYDTVDQMWTSAVKQLLSSGKMHGSRSGVTLEVVGWQGRLTDVSRSFLVNPRRAACPCYASAELLWYLSRSRDGSLPKAYAPSYEQFLDPDGTANGSYGYRVANNAPGWDLLDEAVALLRDSPETRQCVVSVWRPRDLVEAVAHDGGRRDTPCTCLWQFFVRGGELHMETYMRSNDVWLGMPYDVYAFTCIQHLVAGSLGVSPGQYVHTVGSLHLYEKDQRGALEAAGVNGPVSTPSHGWSPATADRTVTDRAAELEEVFRKRLESSPAGAQDVYDGLNKVLDSAPFSPSSLLADSVRCCFSRWSLESSRLYASPVSPALQRGFVNRDRRRKK